MKRPALTKDLREFCASKAREIAELHGIELNHLLAGSRQHHVLAARWLWFRWMRRTLDMPVQSIIKVTGFDGWSIRYGLRKTDEQIETYLRAPAEAKARRHAYEQTRRCDPAYRARQAEWHISRGKELRRRRAAKEQAELGPIRRSITQALRAP